MERLGPEYVEWKAYLHDESDAESASQHPKCQFMKLQAALRKDKGEAIRFVISMLL